MEVLKPQVILFEALIRLESDIPSWINTSVSNSDAPDGCECFGMDLDLDEESMATTIDRFSQRYLAPMTAWMANHLMDLRAKSGADQEIVFFKLPFIRGDVWSEEIRSKKIAMRLRKRYYGDQAHFDLAYKIQKISQVAAA